MGKCSLLVINSFTSSYINLTWYSYMLIYTETMKLFMDIMAVHFDGYTKHVKCTSNAYKNVETGAE